MSDIVWLKVKFDNRWIAALRGNLIESSGYFNFLLNHPVFSTSECIELPMGNEVNWDILYLAVDFIRYEGVVQVTGEFKNYMQAAIHFEIEALKDVLANEIAADSHYKLIHPENVLGFWQLTQYYHGFGRIERLLERFIQKHFQNISTYSLEWKELPLELLVQILDWDSLNVESEKDVLEVIFKWIWHSFSHENHDYLFGRLLGCVRFEASNNFDLLWMLKCSPYQFAINLYLNQYLELMRDPRLVVAINTKPRQKYPGFKQIKRSQWDDEYRKSRRYNPQLDKFEDDTDYEDEESMFAREEEAEEDEEGSDFNESFTLKEKL